VTRRGFYRLLADRRGAMLAEFALVVPLWGVLNFGMLQAADLLWGYAGLQNVVAEGARFATLYPRKTNTEIINRVYAESFSISAANISKPVLTTGKAGSVDYVDIKVEYTAHLPYLNVELMKFR